MNVSSYRFSRALCAGQRTLISGAIALAIASLPPIISFVQTGHYSASDVRAFCHALFVALLIALLNFWQRLRERGQSERERRLRMRAARRR